MKKRKLYQAVEDRDNPDEIEQKGPFMCKRKDAWLGHGYYSWDSFIELAHWWGGSSYDGNYVICLSHCDYTFPHTYDLYNCPEHLENFKVLSDSLGKEFPNKRITVCFVLEMLKSHSDFMTEFQAIRAKADNCWRDVPHIPFVIRNFARLEMIPPIQICVLNKSFLIDGEYQIVYPNKYLSEGCI